MLAKQELFAIPILGRAMRAAEFPSIDRKTGQRALADLQRARAMMESGIVLRAAPEGTRSNGEELLPFKKGCFRLARDTDAVIIPVVIHGIHRVLPAHTLNLTLDQAVQVRIGAPIDTADFAGQATQALMAAVRERMQALFDAPLTPPVSAAPPREPALAE
ncbi:MAG: 1-acyl-sn-glycerol-3-phosphate acyltransferase [Pseudomonas citronellolis]|nr:MAG: 1-acyl-sn-glycerol-3-phosphate acyltransferase [Pseudomonas citronellolis]